MKETIFIKLEYDASTAANFSKDISKPLLCSLKILEHWYHNIPEMGEPNISEDNFTRDAANLLKQDAFSEFYQADIHEFKSFEHQEIKNEINSFETDYGSYEFSKLGSLVNVQSFQDKERFLVFKNSIIEKNIFYVYIENNQKEFRLKIDEDFDFENRELYCFLVNTKKLIPGFVVNFLCSDYGNKSFKLVESEFATVVDLLMREVLIPVPSLEIQQKITAINEKFTKISDELNQLKEILAFKPISSEFQAQS